MPDDVITHLASGRKVINLCMFAWLAAMAFSIPGSAVGQLHLLIVGLAAAIGAAKTGKALGLSHVTRWSSVLGVMIPLVGLPVMAWLSFKARRELELAGYRVGMFTASIRATQSAKE